MKKTKIISILLCICIIFLLVGCGNSTEKKSSDKSTEDNLIGKWQYIDEDSRFIEFSENRKGTEMVGDETNSFTYDISDDKITISADKSSETYKFSIKGDEMTWVLLSSENNREFKFKRVK